MQIQLVMLGKTRRAESRAMLDDYAARIRRFAEIEILEVREDSAALKRLSFSAGAELVLLDADGKQFSTAAFAKWIGSQRDRARANWCFCAAARTDFPTAWREKATASLRFRR